MSEDVRRLVGDNVRRLRIAAGLSQAELAERMGVDRARQPVPTYKSMEREEYPAYYDLTTRPVRQHPIPPYSEDPDEACVYWMSVTSWS
jgi:transcriptional regulator with XRE-family HTH domain